MFDNTVTPFERQVLRVDKWKRWDGSPNFPLFLLFTGVSWAVLEGLACTSQVPGFVGTNKTPLERGQSPSPALPTRARTGRRRTFYMLAWWCFLQHPIFLQSRATSIIFQRNPPWASTQNQVCSSSGCSKHGLCSCSKFFLSAVTLCFVSCTLNLEVLHKIIIKGI